MELSLPMIWSKFDELDQERCSREAASEWARLLRETDDRNELVMVPASERKLIWDALIFIESYDMKTGPNEYLYCREDLLANKPNPPDHERGRSSNASSLAEPE